MADDKLAAAIRQAEEALRAVPNWRELLCGGCGVCEGVKICSGDHESCGCHETLRLVSVLRSLLAALPAEGEAPALTGLEAALVGDRPAPRPSPTPEESRAALLALADAAPEPGTSFLAGGAPTRDSKLPPVTDDEAHEILSRFVASHFRKSDREHARFRIPADPAHDDDLRMAQYIEEARALRSRGISPEVEAAAEALRTSIKRQGADWLEKAWALLDSLAALSSALSAYCDVCESDRRQPCHSTVTGEVALYPHPERLAAARGAKGGR